MGGAAIAADRLHKRYGDVVALDEVSFSVGAGEIFGYLGRNGSGKTTTVRILTTLTRADGGTATVAGIDIADSKAVRTRIGVTLQEAALDPAMTAVDHLRLVAALWGMTRSAIDARVEDVLGAFGLGDVASRRISTLSGGTQRRLDLATSLLSRPEVLFLDEPTTGLDAQSRRALWTELRRLRADGTTVFLTTQYLEEADALSDRIAVVDRGRIIAEGTPAALKERFGRTTITVRLAGGCAALRQAVPDGAVIDNGDGSAVITLAAGENGDRVFAVLDALRRTCPDIDHLGVAAASLEDVFLRLTGSAINAGAAT